MGIKDKPWLGCRASEPWLVSQRAQRASERSELSERSERSTTKQAAQQVMRKVFFAATKTYFD